MAVELGTPGVNSPGLETYLATEPDVLARAMQDASSELYAVDTAQRGWSEVVLTPEARPINGILSARCWIETSQ